jgi:hypothetical protein
MQAVLTGSEALKRLFAALTEHAFQVELGVADPRLVDYVSDLLVRFTRTDVIYRVRNAEGRRLEEVVEMLVEAEERVARPRREIHRHIGDFTLFWLGVYPEALSRLRAADRADSLLDYREQGKLSYRIASEFDSEPYEEEAPVLRRLSDEFELCTAGLRRVRYEWERLPQGAWGAEEN